MYDSQTPPPEAQESVGEEVDTISRVFGNDLWMRFDMWSNRAWETSQKAMAIAEQSPLPMSSDDVVYDPRVGALYHAAGIAQEFAEMVNPMVILGLKDEGVSYSTGMPIEVSLDMISENEELD